MPERYIFTPATQADAGAVLQLYRDVVNTPGCTWDDTYPAMENIAEDLAQGALYCLRDAAGMPAAAAGSGDRHTNAGRMYYNCPSARL